MVRAYNAKQWEVRAILDGRKTCTRRLLKGPFTVQLIFSVNR